MELNEFVANFANQFDDTDPEEIKADTVFHNLDEWSSLTGMAIIAMAKIRVLSRKTKKVKNKFQYMREIK